MPATAYRSQILYMRDDPRIAGEGDAGWYHRDGLIIVENGHVAAIGAYDELAPTLAKDVQVEHFDNALLTPGFIDTHVHFPQTDIIGAYGAQLLDWLNTYTYPAEAAFADRAHAENAAHFFVNELLRNGTTSALVFATSHEHSVDALFSAALAKNMRLYTGKVLMDRNAPHDLCDGADLGRDATVRLIKRWQGKGRLGYAVTPRFAPTSSPEQLQMAGELLAVYPETRLQTHLSENKSEIELAAQLFPQARDYLDIYDRFGLLTERSVFAHSLHMEDDAFERIAKADAAISFCPTSNLFLGSGLFAIDAARRANAQVSIGTDVGAGVSFSILHTLKSAYKVGQLGGTSVDPFTLFYLATLGGAKALGVADKIGQLAPGAEADFVVIDFSATPLLDRRLRAAHDLKERLFALMILGDDRAISHTYIAGSCAHRRDAPDKKTAS